MKLALFIHLISLVVGFGSVLSVDFIGAQWLLGRRKLADVVLIASHAQPLIWAGYTGLVLSGLFLHPNLHSGRTIVKLVAVAIVGLNGINLGYVQKTSQKLGNRSIADSPRWYLVWATVSINISQLAWWTAIIIGFLTATRHL